MENNDKENKNTNNDTLAMELLKEVKAQAKRWTVAFFTVLILWFITIGGFVWYLNQYDFANYEVSTDSGGDANFIGHDGDINGLCKSENAN